MAELTDPKVHMGSLTGGEGRALYAKNPIILMPMGSQEDQGPHAPMGDYLLAEKIAELAAIRASNNGVRTVVAPVVPFGADDYFSSMIGGIALSHGLATQLLDEMVESLYRNGLTRIIIINGHGGNVGPIQQVSRRKYIAHKRIIPSLYLWKIGYALLPAAIGADAAKVAAGHGADPLSSIGMHLFSGMMRPDMVPDAAPLKREERLDLPFASLGTVTFDGAEISVPHEYEEVYHDGVGRGDPHRSSAATGAAMTERLVDLIARFVAHFDAKIKQ